MSVGRLAGSGTETRGRAGRRTRSERAPAERGAAERAAAGGAAAERAAAGSTAAGDAPAERAAAGSGAAEDAAAERGAAGSTAAGDAAAERAAAGSGAAERGPAGSGPAGRTAGASADPRPNVTIVGGWASPATTAQAAPGATAAVPADGLEDDLFARYTRDYVTGRDGQQVMILQAGCTTAETDLDVGVLRDKGADITVSLIDDDQPVTSAALSMHQDLAECVQGDLRTVALPPRSHDIVLCALLLQRTSHAELVLDRLAAAIRPGGLLLLRFSDRDSAAGFLDRVLPTVARRAIWRRRRPGEPGPYPAVYERLSSARGIQAYALKRELVIAERQALGGVAGTLAGPPGFRAAQKLTAWLSRGRLTAAHEQLLYVLRKPEDRFARIL